MHISGTCTWEIAQVLAEPSVEQALLMPEGVATIYNSGETLQSVLGKIRTGTRAVNLYPLVVTAGHGTSEDSPSDPEQRLSARRK